MIALIAYLDLLIQKLDIIGMYLNNLLPKEEIIYNPRDYILRENLGSFASFFKPSMDLNSQEKCKTNDLLENI